MDILLYLTELLQTSKTVGIVGLGTLYKKKSPGRYVAEKHSFVPPTYRLAFTAEVKEDTALSTFISEKRNITIDSAKYYIGNFAERIQAELANSGVADLESLGRLQLVNNEVVLIPGEESNVSFDFYGLPEIAESGNDIPNNTAAEETKLADIEEEKKIEEENPGQTIEPEASVNLSLNDTADESQLAKIEEENKLEEENPGQETENDFSDSLPLADDQTFVHATPATSREEKNYTNLDSDYKTVDVFERNHDNKVDRASVSPGPAAEDEEYSPPKGMPFFMKVLIALLAIVALGAIIYFINPNFFSSYFNRNTSGQHDKIVSALPNDSLIQQIDTNKNDSIANDNSLVTLAKDTVATIDSSRVTIYEVLVSAVSTHKKADKIIANLAREGVTAKKINLSKTMINISAGTFLTEQAAKKHRDSLRVKLKNQGIYIQPIKPKTYKK